MSNLSLSNISFKPYCGEPKTIKMDVLIFLQFFNWFEKCDSILKYSEFFEVRMTFNFSYLFKMSYRELKYNTLYPQ